MEQEENLDLVEEGDEKDEEEDGLSLYNNKEEGGEVEPDNEADLFLLGLAVAGNRLLDLKRSKFAYFNIMSPAGGQNYTARLSHFYRCFGVFKEKNILHSAKFRFML